MFFQKKKDSKTKANNRAESHINKYKASFKKWDKEN